MPSWLIRALLGVAGTILQLIITRLTEKKVFDRALNFARLHVPRLASIDTMTNEQKRTQAIDLVRKDLKDLGMTVRDVLLGVAVELAVSETKVSS